MRKDWTETTLGEIASFYNGKTYKQEELLDSGKYRVLRVGNFFSNGNWYWSDLELEENKYCDRGDLLYAWSASFGPRIWSEEKVIYHYHIWKIVEDSSLVSKHFLYFWLDEDVLRMKRDTGNGSIMMHITKGGIEARTIQLPPLAEQKRIVDLVSSVDAYLNMLQQQVDSARVARSAVLHDLLSACSEDWTETTLGEVSEFTRGPFGGSLKKGIFVKSGYAVFEQQHAIYGDFSSFRYFVIAEKFEEMSRFKVSAGDLIMSCSGTIGKVSIVPPAAPQGIINQALLKISPKSEIMGEFLLFWTQSEIFKLIIGENSGGAVQQNVASVKILKNIAIALPPLAEQKRIIEVVSSMDEVIQSTEQAVDDAKALRSGLLSDLLSGNHEIPASYDSLLGAA